MTARSATTHGATIHAFDHPGFAFTETTHPPNLRLAPHAHRHPAITFVLHGGFIEAFGAREHLCRPMSVLFKPADAVHSNRYSPAGARSFIVECTTDAELFRGFRRSGPQLGIAPLIPLLVELREAVRWGGAERLVTVEELALEIVHRVGAGASWSDRHPPRWLARIEELARDGCTGRIRLGALAAEAGVHPVYLARVFRRHLGRSIGSYMLQCRIELAMARLAASDDSISLIALETGFTDQPHFTRCFRREVRMTPARFRRLVADRFGSCKTGGATPLR
jgi:AraC family transcriptional regulator